MTHGLLVRNLKSQLQIDSVYQNYALWESGSITTSKQGAGNDYTGQAYFTTPTPYAPLVAFKPSASVYCGFDGCVMSGNNFTGIRARSYFNTTVTVDWMAFVPRKDKSAEAYGMRVYNTYSEMVFDSGHRPLIITDVDIVTPSYSGVVNVTHPIDADAYFAMAPSGFYQVVTNSYPPVSQGANYWPMMLYVDTTTISFGGRVGSSFQIPAPVSAAGGYWPSSFKILTIRKVV